MPTRPTHDPVCFRLLSVGVEEFVVASEGDTADDYDDLFVRYAFSVDLPTRRVSTLPRFAFRSGDKEALILTVRADFDIDADDWSVLTAEQGGVTLPTYLLQHLGVIATGFARGVLHEKAQTLPGREALMLPIIRVVDFITEDLTFPDGQEV